MRKLFIGQNLDIVVTQSTQETLIGNSRKMIDIIRTALKNQAINKSNETFRSFKEQIPNLFRTKLMEQLLKLTPEKAADLGSASASFFESKFEDIPLTQFGLLNEEAKSYDILEEIGKDQLKRFDQSLEQASAVLDKKTAEDIRQKVSEEINALILRAKEYPELNCLFLKTGAVELGLQMQCAVNIEQNNQMQSSLQINVEEETRRYGAEHNGDIFKEIPWNSNGIDPWNLYRIGPELLSVSSLFQDYDNDDDKWIKRKGLYQNNYSNCFPANIKMTENLRQTVNVVLPVFHPLQKSGEQLLVRKLPDGSPEVILLSQKDLAFWVQRGETPKGMWLVNAEGMLLVKGAGPLPDKRSYFWNNLEEALWYVNFFNGNAAALERRPFLTQILLNNAKAPMRRFLYLRTAHQPGQRNVLEKSSVFGLSKGGELVNNVRYAREREKQSEVEKMDEKEIGTLKAEYASLVPSEKVPFLKEPEQIRSLLPKQINKINPEHANSLLSRQVVYLEKPELIQTLTEPSLIKEIPAERACHLTEAQRIHHSIGIKEEKDPVKIQKINDPELINQLGPEQVKEVLPEQVAYINPKHVSRLEKPEQIEKLEGRNQINAIDGSALKYLTPDQYRQLRNPVLIGQVPRDSIKYLDPLAIPFLDVKTQLPYIELSQHPYIGKEQYQKISKEEVIPENLKALWSRINPQACNFYKEILKQTGRLLSAKMPGTNEWEYLLQQMGELKEEDYAKVKKIILSGLQEKEKVALPSELFQCKELTEFHVSNFDISSFELGTLTFNQFFPNLTRLVLCRCELKIMPPSIRKLSKLTSLKIEHNLIEIIPDWIGELTNLKSLDFYQNKITEVAPGIGKLTSLQFLYLDYNELTTLPQEIGHLSELDELMLNNNQLKELPCSLGELKKLTSLYIYNNKLTSIPGSVAALPAIENIYAANNCISTLPPEMANSPAMSLSLALNPIKEFPKVCYEMTKLSLLDLEGCHIQELTEEISNLQNIYSLYLSGNPLVSISDEIGKLKRLNGLSVQGTRLKNLPETFGELSNLHTLYLAHTPIERLPKSLVSSQNLQKIGLKETHIARDSPDVQALLARGCVVDYDNLGGVAGIPRPIDTKIPQWLIEGKSDPEKKPTVSPEALQDLISADKHYPIQQLIRSGLDPNTKLGEQDSLLHWAIRNGHDELTKEVLEKGGDFTAADQNGETPLTLLCRNFPTKADLIQQMIAKRDKETFSVSEGKALISAIHATTDLVKRHQLHNSFSFTIANKLPKSSLAESLKKTSQETSNQFLATCLEKTAEYFEIGHLFFAMVSEKITNMFRTLFGLSPEEPSWKEIGLSSYLLEKELHNQKEEANQTLTKVTNGQVTIEEFQKLSAEKRSELLRWASIEGKQDATSLLLLTEAKLSPKIHNNDKLITNLFLDKSWIMTNTKEVSDSDGLTQEGLYGMCPHIAALAIADGLKKTFENPKQQIPEKLVKQIGEELIPQLQRAAVWERLSSSREGTALVVDQIFDRLKDLENNKKILVPVGNRSHNFLVQIHKIDAEKYSLKVVNTGLGLSHHPSLGNQRFFQTAIVFEEIPAASIFQKEVWKELLDLQGASSDSVDKHYELIEKKLGAGGKKVSASKERLDYSTAQLQGTCSSSPWWSWLRHEVVASGTEKGDRWLAYAQWRVMKNQVREAILQGVESGTLKEKVQQSALEKIKRDAHFSDLIAISQDSNRFNETIAIVKQMLEKLPAEVKDSLGNIDRDFIDYENSGARWHLLRQISRRFAKEIHLMNPKKRKRFINDINEQSKDPCLSHAFLQLVDFQNTEKHLEMLLKDAEKNNEWKLIGTTIGRLVLDPKLSSLVTRLCKRWLTLGEETKSRLL
ncbi:MAG TPA: leucine-rich repeat domain-containing protein, partial [Waddliaceae bacterium]